MSAASQTEANAGDNRFYGLEHIEASRIPARHPVSLFAECYSALTDGHLLPSTEDVASHPDIEHVMRWVVYVEPVEVENVVDFYVLDWGRAADANDTQFMRAGWMSESVDEEFVEARYYEATTASILRKSMFSRGAVPSVQRAFIMQYRGVFPLFANNQARLRLAIVAAETYTEVKN